MDSSSRTRAMVEGALMACLTAVLALIGIYLPFLAVLTSLVFTIPIIIVTIRHGVLTGVLSILTAGLLVFTLYEPLRGFMLLLQYGGLSIFYGYAFAKELNSAYTLGIGAVIGAISLLLTFYVGFIVTGISDLAMFQQMKASVGPSIEMLKQLGYFNNSGVSEEAFRQFIISSIDNALILIPAVFVLYGMMVAIINHIISQKILRKMGIHVQPLPPFTEWRLPWWTIYGFILGYGFNLLGNFWGNDLWIKIGYNISSIYGIIFLVLGLSLVLFLQKKYLPGRMYRTFIFIFLVFFYPIISWIMMIIGIVDLLFNYRSRIRGN